MKSPKIETILKFGAGDVKEMLDSAPPWWLDMRLRTLQKTSPQPSLRAA